MQKNPFDKAMNAFTHGRDFIRGELYLFVYDTMEFSLPVVLMSGISGKIGSISEMYLAPIWCKK